MAMIGYTTRLTVKALTWPLTGQPTALPRSRWSRWWPSDIANASQVNRYNILSPHLFLHGRAICGTSLLVPCRDGQGCRPLGVQQA